VATPPASANSRSSEIIGNRLASAKLPIRWRKAIVSPLQLTAKHKVATPVNWKHARTHRRFSQRRRAMKQYPQG
jgi:hypothetical protein